MTSYFPRHAFRFSQLLSLWLLAVLGVRAPAQCATQWLPGSGVPGIYGQVLATVLWDPDGTGPLPPALVVGGSTWMAGTTVTRGIAAYDFGSRSWSSLGSGIDGDVSALTTLPNGDLVAGGYFATAGGVSANNIARWNGTTWSPLGSGMNAGVTSLTKMANGDLVAGGSFSTAGGVSASRIARWNGTSWSALGSGLTGFVNPSVAALATLANGDLIAAGYFDTAGGVSANSIARWNGTSWAALGSGMSASPVSGVVEMPNGDLVACGSFQSAGGALVNNIARWDGTSWSALSSGIQGSVYSLLAMGNGDLVTGGSFTNAGGISANRIARWDGTTWSVLGTGISNNSVRALASLPNGGLVAGGDFTVAGSVGATGIAQWDGTNWSALSSGTNNSIFALATLPNGDLVAGGSATVIQGVIANGIARWNGNTWSALGAGMSYGIASIAPYVRAVATLPNGDLVAGGLFTTAGGVNADAIARWNGTSWSAMGSGLQGWVNVLATMANGDLVAGGTFTTAGGVVVNNIARWNGSSWSALGYGIRLLSPHTTVYASVTALMQRPNGDLVAAGYFNQAGSVGASCIASWDGATWSTFGTGLGYVLALIPLPNGDFVAGGNFLYAGGVAGSVAVNNIARWNGTSWAALGSGMDNVVSTLTKLPNGDLVASGPFTTAGGVSANKIARWNGAIWSALGSGMNQAADAFATRPNGDLVAGGYFTIVNGAVSRYLAQLTTTCPATAVASGTGCTGSGGPNVLTATALPWTGSTFRALATGMPANGVALGVRGLTTAATPLATILPQGVAGCTLLVSPDLTDLHVPTTGSLQTQFAIPNTVALANQILHYQVVSLELAVPGSITALTSTNALTLTLGTF